MISSYPGDVWENEMQQGKKPNQNHAADHEQGGLSLNLAEEWWLVNSQG
ncbi:Uncharacterised protein [Streptococcus pneumoniae]|nr:Uncharacterised protein [Streptococcus pneumoniae]COH71835.1 Uncharacterised protein [Streptococcus pneumoniae]